MPLSGNLNIISKLRGLYSFSPGTFLVAADSALRENYEGIIGTAIAIEGRDEILAAAPSSIDSREIRKALKLQRGDERRLEIINKGKGFYHSGLLTDLISIPLHGKDNDSGTFYIVMNRSETGNITISDREEISEILSVALKPVLMEKPVPLPVNRNECLKSELVAGAGNSELCRKSLEGVIEITGAEICSFYSRRDPGKMNILMEGRELASLAGFVTRKTLNSYRHYANGEIPEGGIREKVYYRNSERNIRYLIGSVSIESYFLVPVIISNRIEGVIFAGSTRKNGFSRQNIAELARIAGDESGTDQIVYRQCGEIELIDKIIDRIPFGAAVISRAGELLSVNSRFSESLNAGGAVFETLEDISSAAGYNFMDYLSELKITGKDINGRILAHSGGNGNQLEIYWTLMDRCYEKAHSLLIITGGQESGQEQEREYMAMVAHELRTPLSALKNSLSILSEEGAFSDNAESRGNEDSKRGSIFKNALRTAGRLNSMLESLDIKSRDIMGRDGLKDEKGKIGAIVESALSLYRKQADHRGISLKLNIDRTQGLIETDFDRTTQVVQNLISNSLKSGSREIEVSVSRIMVPRGSLIEAIPWDRIIHPSYFRISVLDDGNGYPREVIEYVNRLSERDINPAFGLGLYVSGTIAKSLGGMLRVDNRDGGGGASHLYLPEGTEAREAVKAVYAATGIFYRMKDLGMVPILYLIGKESNLCWLELSQGWREVPVINPDNGYRAGDNFYLWPLSARVAIGVCRGGSYLVEPEKIITGNYGGLYIIGSDRSGRFDVGWSVWNDNRPGISSILREAEIKLEKGYVKNVEQGV